MNKIYQNCRPIVLAAGKGTRMHSIKPKVLQTLLGEPMLAYVINALSSLFEMPPLIVAGHKAEMLEKHFPDSAFVIQQNQQGTGDALTVALAALDHMPEYVLVTNGDAPLITTEIIDKFIAEAKGQDLAFATIFLKDPASYGRVYRKDGQIQAIIEARDYNSVTHGEITGEVNAGLYLIKSEVARNLLPELTNQNKSGEYYITDLVRLAFNAGLSIAAVDCGDDQGLLGVNSPSELADAEEILRQRMVNKALDAGVIIHNQAQTSISPFVRVEPGAEISGPCMIYGKSIIQTGAVIEGFCVIKDSVIESGAHVLSFCHLEQAHAEANTRIGPYTRLRPGALLKESSHAGNFVELKNATLGNGAKANHLSYLGDADIGQGVNIGAGTITCNYDGTCKHHTSIGENAFIGSNTALVAPVNIGCNAVVGAGSVITKNVPDNELGITRSAQKNIPWRKK